MKMRIRGYLDGNSRAVCNIERGERPASSPPTLPVAESGGQIAGYTIADHLESRPKTGWLMRLPAAAIEGFRGIGAEGVLPRGRTGEPRRHEQRFTAGRCIPRRCPGDRKGLTLLD